MALDERDQLVRVSIVGALECADVRLVVVADEVAHCLAVALRPRVEVRADRVLVAAAVAQPAEAAQEQGGQGGRAGCQQQAFHRSRVMRSGGKKISFSPSKTASR